MSEDAETAAGCRTQSSSGERDDDRTWTGSDVEL